jgi:hypothetical protein
VRIAIAALGLAGCFSKPPRPVDGVDPDGWLEGYAYRRLVELDSGLAGALTNVPVVVALEADAGLAEHARSDGSDIVATLDGETQLPSEVARFAAGDLELWVELPELAPISSFHIYYGGLAATRTSPWNPTRFAGVWHLSESSDPAPDSTGRTTLTPVGTVGHGDGVFGTARVFGGGSSLDGGNPPELAFGTESFSYSLWVNQTANNDPFDIVLYKGCAKAAEPGFCFLVGSGPWAPKILDGAGAYADPTVGTGPIHDAWVHLAAVVDRPNELRGYRDGVVMGVDASIGTIGTMTTTEPFAISRPDIFYTGRVDEVRIYNGVVPDDWFRLEHRMGDPSSGFSTVGAEEQL